MMLPRVHAIVRAGLLLALCCSASLAAQEASDGSKAVRLSAGVIAGQLLTKVQPVIPAEAIMAHVSGAVILHVMIGQDGRVAQVEAISGPQMLRAAAIDAVRQWRYKPILVNGEPVSVETTITLIMHSGSALTSDKDEPPVRVSGGEMAGRVLKQVNAVFPHFDRQARVSGAVVLRVIIGVDGLVKHIDVISGPELLRAAIIDAVRQWTYRPYLAADGHAVPVETTVTVHVDFGAAE